MIMASYFSLCSEAFLPQDRGLRALPWVPNSALDSSSVKWGWPSPPFSEVAEFCDKGRKAPSTGPADAGDQNASHPHPSLPCLCFSAGGWWCVDADAVRVGCSGHVGMRRSRC